jgi:predicted small secreted protein
MVLSCDAITEFAALAKDVQKDKPYLSFEDCLKYLLNLGFNYDMNLKGEFIRVEPPPVSEKTIDLIIAINFS